MPPTIISSIMNIMKAISAAIMHLPQPSLPLRKNRCQHNIRATKAKTIGIKGANHHTAIVISALIRICSHGRFTGSFNTFTVAAIAKVISTRSIIIHISLAIGLNSFLVQIRFLR